MKIFFKILFLGNLYRIIFETENMTKLVRLPMEHMFLQDPTAKKSSPVRPDSPPFPRRGGKFSLVSLQIN